MPEFDGTQIFAILSFAGLVLAWLIAPTSTATVAAREPLPAAA
jgi:hypothetical protein